MNVWNEFWRIPLLTTRTPLLPPPAPSPSLSNYIIIFLSIKIQMHNLNIWQQQAEREAFCSAAGSKVAFDERRMLNWHCCGKKKKKAKENNKRKTILQNFPPCEIWRHYFKSVTQKHIDRYEIFSKVTARLHQVEAQPCVGKHLSICGCFTQLYLS